MANARKDFYRPVSHPFYIVLAVSMFPLFLGAMLADWAYLKSFQVQWLNFASWMNAGALVFAGAALLWSLASALSSPVTDRRTKWIFAVLVGVTFVVGFVDALIHAKDAGATMPTGLYLSVVVLILAVVTLWYGLTARIEREPS